jgi:CRISPR-associated protein Csx3
MYTHAHIRYAEALARFGAAKELWQALQQINPIGLRELVPSSSLRQLNCYYSSSDADFADRYEAAEQYNKLHSGDVSLEGGWRVYSSGSGIAVRVMVQCFLGLRIGIDEVVIDPVIDPSLSGLVVECRLDAYHWQVIYHIGPEGTGPQSVKLNDVELTGTRLIHPYRCGGLRFSIQEWRIFASGGMDRLVIVLG